MVPKIGTHSGRFHTDEILATVLLKYLPEYKDAEIVRTRDPKKLDECDVVVDVGGVYDHSKKRYDHHQKEFNDTLDSKHSIRLSSAGLIYKHYGHEVLRKAFKIEDEVKVNKVYDCVYTHLIESIDAIDNGVNQYDGAPVKYLINTTLQNRVNRFNPNYLEEDVNEDDRFKDASKIVKEEFEHFVHYFSDVWYQCRSTVLNAINSRFDFHKSGRVIFFESNCPFYEHLYEIEKEQNIVGQILFSIYKDRYNNIRCGTISKENENFTIRMPFPEAYRGLKDEELQSVSKNKGLTFVHYSGFTSAGKDIESLIKLVEDTLKLNNISY